MDHALLVGVLQTKRGLADALAGFADSQFSALLNHLVQVDAFDVIP